ncbi:MAG: cysteine--tRNA ligase [Candidatus Pacebacteria bacterium]|jgi:cysteinyl-tRNA synthetase|nr:cysteine--tRNA ligase [Parcubacteria group bacterium]MDP6249374.1 cysteine--tRNA ligase [Candidatus Paceibacterota bacterium]MDP7159138.1 cysteine--tRNA ligase [Candidatus Paceibacterota bacterium]MDP7368089.1 cysteine--tRNA ligase [Candidatus Paceibacterota bacterium]MDP7466023.1 cysteine--tRNA ligase [Candidatus Paceibacterota bacterium]|tara:strand:- start:18048 stop:19484 length:1437 start_codon:yes stop_codon:yes gene_type:complete
MVVKFHNTLTNENEEFKPRKESAVTMYNCGPTVYDYATIGNLRAYVFADSIKRVLKYSGYDVKQVINITDVGHLTSDADEGEDKVESGAKREGIKVKDIVKRYTNAFFNDLKKLNVDTKNIIFPKATEYIGEQITFIQTLDEKGYTYKTSDGIYFDTSLLPDYGKLGNIDTKGLKEGARIKKGEKKNPTDFALWKFSPPAGGEEKRQQEWDSPWGVGFPGWHIECSAMSMKHLGKQIDIHTGGVDHIPVHHNNEIAQTESVTGKQFVNYWMHNEFITIEGQKIAKSLGNTIYLKNIIDRGLSPLSLRYWFLTAHYRTKANFTWDALEAAQTALFKLHKHFVEEYGAKKGGVVSIEYKEKFDAFVNNDLDIPQTIALIWDLIKDENVPKEDKRSTLLSFDEVLGLGLDHSNKKLVGLLSGKGEKLKVGKLPEEIKNLVDEREKARKKEDFEKADAIRDELKEKGYEIEDTDKGPEVSTS